MSSFNPYTDKIAIQVDCIDKHVFERRLMFYVKEAAGLTYAHARLIKTNERIAYVRTFMADKHPQWVAYLADNDKIFYNVVLCSSNDFAYVVDFTDAEVEDAIMLKYMQVSDFYKQQGTYAEQATTLAKKQFSRRLSRLKTFC